NQIQYELHIVESELLNTEQVTIADLKQNLRETGKQAFYGIYFATGEATLQPESATELALIATFVRENPDLEAFVVGHTDLTGDYEANLSLSQARAQAVLEALVNDHGVEVGNLRPVGVGPVAPVATNRTGEGRAKNRRVELVLGKFAR
ncbi:MAG: OmpA family protein, partial [Bacteroidota bacterium]